MLNGLVQVLGLRRLIAQLALRPLSTSAWAIPSTVCFAVGQCNLEGLVGGRDRLVGQLCRIISPASSAGTSGIAGRVARRV